MLNGATGRLKTVLAALAALYVVASAESPARAELDAVLQKPYDLHVVLHFAEHRALTPIFREQVEYQLLNHLRLTFGKLANVKILQTNRLLDAVRVNGLQQALDGWDELSGVKTHFVLIDFINGRYEIQARQHDGVSGLNSPVVRRDATSDPLQVARRAALLVDRDFALTGTVVGRDGVNVQVALLGGGLGVSLSRWLKSGDIFAVARITGESGKPRAIFLDWTILQAVDGPKDGMCRCHFVTRFRENELVDGEAILGYRALKLTTISAPLRLRLLELGEEKSGIAPLPGVQVHVGRTGFDDPEALKLTSGPDGLVVTDQTCTNVAFVSVLGSARARFPVAIVDERTVICRLRANPEADSQEQLELRKGRWQQRIYDLHAAAGKRIEVINKQLQSDREGALSTAQAAVTGLQGEIEHLQKERDELRELGDKLSKGSLDLSAGDQALEQLRQVQGILTSTAANIQNVLAEENSEQRKNLRSMLERANLLETQADYDEAIKLYQKVLAESPNESQVKKRLQGLEEAWRIKDNPAHQQARDFIYNDWARPLDIAGIKAALPGALKALGELKKAGDHLSARKFVLADLVHAATIAKRLETLNHQRVTEDTVNETRTIRQLAEALDQLHNEAVAYARQGKKSAS
jgi:tetratricopeptide (TPR) repeat protein